MLSKINDAVGSRNKGVRQAAGHILRQQCAAAGCSHRPIGAPPHVPANLPLLLRTAGRPVRARMARLAAALLVLALAGIGASAQLVIEDAKRQVGAGQPAGACWTNAGSALPPAAPSRSDRPLPRCRSTSRALWCTSSCS